MDFTDVKRRPSIRAWHPSQPGEPLTLTIDERLQYVAERQIAAAVDAHNAAAAAWWWSIRIAGIFGAGQLPNLRSEPASRAGESPAARQNHAVSCLRAGIGLQGHHPLAAL